MSIRNLKSIGSSKPTIEGAGVHLRRAFGFGQTQDSDPFLLFDDFRGDNPSDYKAGFPWHPHRGIETITYVLAGSVEHKDSLGNTGLMQSGDIQWMTAGSGIIHQEMPTGDSIGRMHGFQLWANLPSRLKMTSPRYQDIVSSAVPEVEDDDGTRVRILCGEFWGKKGPVEGVAADPSYLDIFIPPNQTRNLDVELDRNAFAYVFEGNGFFYGASLPQGVLTESTTSDIVYRAEPVDNRYLIRFDNGDFIRVSAGPQGMRFLLASGRPLGEPVAWHGPIVMNTQAEIQQALSDLESGNFIK